MSNFEIRQDENGIGNVLILKGEWTDDVSSYMQTNDIFALRLTDSFGFKGQDISFLSKLDFLRSLELYCWDAKGVKIIESLPQLEILGLQYKSAQKIDLSAFSRLRIALVSWSKGLGSLLELSSLEKLNIKNYPHSDLKPISSMQELKQLYLTSKKLESLNGIEQLNRLEKVDLYNCPNLKSLVGIESCQYLNTIEIEACNRVRA
jgi:uncharacterized protein with PQ loop repeat